MDEKIKKLLGSMSAEGADLTLDLVEQLNKPREVITEEEAQKLFHELNELVIKAKNNIKLQEMFPICTYCANTVDDVEYMFKHENGRLAICSECVDRSYKKLNELRNKSGKNKWWRFGI